MRNLSFYILMVLLILVASCKKDATGTATIIYQDSLTTNDQTWYVDSTINEVTQFSGGHYSIRGVEPNQLSFSTAPYGNINFPYSVQVDGTIDLDNSGGSDNIALIFNHCNNSNYDIVDIWTNGTYRIWQKVNGNDSILLNNTFNSAINTGSGSKNTIKVIQNQSNMQLLVNGVSMCTYNIGLPAVYVEAGIGIGTSGANFTPVTGLFNNFSISKN